MAFCFAWNSCGGANRTSLRLSIFRITRDPNGMLIDVITPIEPSLDYAAQFSSESELIRDWPCHPGEPLDTLAAPVSAFAHVE